MASNKKLDGKGLSQVWSRIKENFVSKGILTDDLIDKLKNISGGGEANVINSISVNGVVLEVEEKGVNIRVPTGNLASLDKVGQEQLSEALATLITGKANKATSLNGYGIEDAYTKEETENAITEAVGKAVAGVYKVKGSTTFASLPVEGMSYGYVYNITDDFTAGNNFVESEVGKKYPAGTNVVYTENGWDAMAGIFDYSDFLLKSELEDLTEEEINAICVMPNV